MDKEKNPRKANVISFDEFIDEITDGRGEQIKKDLKKIEDESH